MAYTDGEIKQYIREVVRETKDTARVDTGYLRRSIRGDLTRGGVVEFREIFYGAYKNNAKLIENAKTIMPNDIPWKVIFVDEEGTETAIEGTTRTGRKISKKSVTSKNVSTDKIKSLIAAIKSANAKEKDSTTEGRRNDNSESP